MKTSRLGIIELNRPEVLNALNEETLADIESRLAQWENDPSVACVLIHSQHPKAFCSGGDVKALAQNKMAGGGIEKAASFFTQEYFTDYFAHRFKKPIVAWLDGICMGGGIGLTQGASHRIVTERTVMAMPEVFIGLFPDVGGSKFLSNLRNEIGLYLGLTGAKFSGSTATAIGLTDYLLPSSSKQQVVSDLTHMNWSDSSEENRAMLDEYFVANALKSENEFAHKWPNLEKIFARGDFAEIVKALPQEGRQPSLLSQAVFYRLAQMNKDRNWPEVFMQEWSTALHFSADASGANGLGEFAEGVRALLIAKEPVANWPERSIADAWREAEKFLTPFEPNNLRARLQSL